MTKALSRTQLPQNQDTTNPPLVYDELQTLPGQRHTTYMLDLFSFLNKGAATKTDYSQYSELIVLGRKKEPLVSTRTANRGLP